MTNSPAPIGNYSAPSTVLPATPIIGTRRACPDCGRPQHYTGIEAGWSHDAGWAHVDLVDTWHCNDPRKAGA